MSTISNLAKIVCKNIPTLNQEIYNSPFESSIKNMYKNITRSTVENLWETSDEASYAFNLLCAGIQLKSPTYNYESNRVTLNFKSFKHPMNIDTYCNSYHQTLRNLNAHTIKES